MDSFGIKILKNKEHTSLLIESTGLFYKMKHVEGNSLIYLLKNLERIMKIEQILNKDIISNKLDNLLKIIDDDVQILQHSKF